MEQKRALVTGITGQDGSYLVELLLSKGYHVYGIIRRSSHFNTARIDHLFQDVHLEDRNKLELIYGDLSDGSSISKIIRSVQPHEVYNLAAQSHVKVSFENPEYTADVTGVGTLRILQAIKEFAPKAKFYQASSSEMFGRAGEFGFVPQNEKTPFYPASPYGAAKLFAHNITVNYRDSYKLFACSGILFNHESPRRGMTFVTRKITRGIAMIANDLQDKIYLGNLDAKRDWGFAPDYVRAMWMMLQQDQPDDYVIATGETHTIKEFVIEAFRHAGIKDWENYIAVDPRYYRPQEVNVLLGDATKARTKLGWKPEVSFSDLVKIMVQHDMEDVTKTIEGRTDKLNDHKWSDSI